MAESLGDKLSRNGDDLDGRDAVLTSSKDAVEDSCGIPECAVCLQSCVHPCRLPCGHIFCFLCIKGTVATAHPGSVRRCAMCRREIPPDFLDKPVLLCPVFPSASASAVQHVAEASSINPSSEQEGYQWFYEGRNGWWQYDERTSLELEGAYKRGERSCELLIAGFLYVADFDGMVQLRRGDPSRRRRIKRDLASIPVKGVAGLRTRCAHGNAAATVNCQLQPPPADDQCFPQTSGRQGNQTSHHHYGSSTAPPTPVNSPGSTTPPRQGAGAPYSPASSSLRRVVEEMGRLVLTGNNGSGVAVGPGVGGGGRGEEGGTDADVVVLVGAGAAPEEESVVGGVSTGRSAVESVLWSPVSPDVALTSPWVLTLSSDEDQL